MTRALALAEDRAAARTAVVNSLRDLRRAINAAELEVLDDQVPRIIPLALKVESVDECVHLWDAIREAQIRVGAHSA